MNAPVPPQDIPLVQKIVAVLWPSFLTAGLATVIFFTVFDPTDLHPFGAELELSHLGYYTLGFFCFWGLTLVSCLLTVYFRAPCHRLSSHAHTPDAR
jgi:hypothetical protein